MVQKKNLAIIAKEEKKEVKTVTSKNVNLDTLQKENQDMKKQLAELLKKLEAKPQSIDEQILYFEKKKERINRLRTFEKTQMEISEALDTLKGNQSNEMFSNENFKIIFGTKNSYNNEIGKNLFSISNTDLLLNFIENLNKQVDIKIVELKKEISL